jgi:glutaredoxin
VADLRSPGADGSFVVQTMERAAFDALVDKTAGVSIQAPVQTTAAADDDNHDDNAAAQAAAPIVIYKASWCGACKAAAAYLRQRGVPFVERDVEKDLGAQAEMQRKAQAAGVQPRGVPVIDFRGQLILGFDQQRLGQLIDHST